MAGMLGWVRGLAESVSDGGAEAAGLVDGYFPAALGALEAVARKRARRVSMTNGALLQEMGCKCCSSSTNARNDVQCSKTLQLLVQHPGSDSNNLTVAENKNVASLVIERESNLNGQRKHECKCQFSHRHIPAVKLYSKDKICTCE